MVDIIIAACPYCGERDVHTVEFLSKLGHYIWVECMRCTHKARAENWLQVDTTQNTSNTSATNDLITKNISEIPQ